MTEENTSSAIETSAPDTVAEAPSAEPSFTVEQPAPEVSADESRQAAISAALGYGHAEPEETINKNESAPESDNQIVELKEEENQETKPENETEEIIEEKPSKNPLESFFNDDGTILSDEEIDVKFDRVPKAARTEMKKYAAEARKYSETVNQLGSEEILTNAVSNYQAFQKGIEGEDFTEFLKNIAVSGGFDGLFGLMDETLFRVFDETRERPTDPIGQKLYDATVKIADANFQKRYGEGYSLKMLDDLVNAHKQNLVDLDLLDGERPETSSEALKYKTENEALREEIRQLQEGKPQQQAEPTAGFENHVTQEIKDYLKPVFNDPTLQILPEDSGEMKVFKSGISEAIIAQAEKSFRSSEKFKQLQERFQNGTLSLPDYKTQFQKEVKSSAFSTAKFTLAAQQLISSLYKNSHNSIVAERINPEAEGDVNQPTQPKQIPQQELTEEQRAQARKMAIQKAVGDAESTTYSPFR